MGLHSPFARQLTRIGLEASISPPLDHSQRRSLARDPGHAVGAHRVTGDLEAQVVRSRKVSHRLNLDRHLRDLKAGAVEPLLGVPSDSAIGGKIPPECVKSGTPTA